MPLEPLEASYPFLVPLPSSLILVDLSFAPNRLVGVTIAAMQGYNAIAFLRQLDLRYPALLVQGKRSAIGPFWRA